jgi:hypothetical protein
MAITNQFGQSANVSFRGIIKVLKLVAGLVCLLAVLGKIAGSTHFIFNDGRLAPVFSMLKGNPPFYPLNQGPLLNTVYGPLSYVYYFPCGLFSHNVSLAIMAGSLLSFLAFAIPVGFVLFGQRNSLAGGQIFWLGTLCTFQAFVYSGVAYSAFNIHADAPAILFSSLCVLLLDRPEATLTSLRALCLSATFGVLTVWTKQTYAAVLLLPLVVAMVEKQVWKTRLVLLVWITLLNLLLVLVFSRWCGFDALWENLVKIPGAFPSGQVSFLYGSDAQAAGALQGQFRSFVVSAHVLFGKYLTPYLICFLLYLLNRLKNGWSSPSGNLTIHVPRLAGLFFLLALFNLPLAADSAIKLSGPSVNDDTPFAWFLILAIFCLIVKPQTVAGAAETWRASRAIYAVFAAIALLGLAGAARHLSSNLKAISTAFQNDEAAVTAACRQSPGKYYFPWHPLAAYFGEGRFYHWEYIAELRAGVGKPLTLEHFNQYLPPRASVICLPLDNATGEEGFLGPYVQNLQPSGDPQGSLSNRFALFSFEHKP